MTDVAVAWRAFPVKPQREFKTAAALAAEKYVAFAPTETRQRRKSRYCRARVAYAYPMIVGYVFVRLPADYPWGRVLEKCPDVRQPVRAGDRLLAVPDPAIERLRQLEQAALPHTASANTRRSFSVGDLIDIVAGPYQGWTTTVEEIRGTTIRAQLQILGGKRAVDIPCELVQAA